jgi:hypothetical protein
MKRKGQISGVCVECADKEECLSVCGRKNDEVLNQTREMLRKNNVTDPESLEKLMWRVWDLDWKYNYLPGGNLEGKWRNTEEFLSQKAKIARRLREPNRSALDALEFYYRTLRNYAARKLTTEHDISTLSVSFGPYTKNNCGWYGYDMVYAHHDIRQIFCWMYEQVQDTYYFTNVDPHSWLYGKWVRGKKPPYDWMKVNEY